MRTRLSGVQLGKLTLKVNVNEAPGLDVTLIEFCQNCIVVD